MDDNEKTSNSIKSKFYRYPHFISNNAHKDLATILVNLNRKTVTKFNGDFFTLKFRIH